MSKNMPKILKMHRDILKSYQNFKYIECLLEKAPLSSALIDYCDLATIPEIESIKNFLSVSIKYLNYFSNLVVHSFLLKEDNNLTDQNIKGFLVLLEDIYEKMIKIDQHSFLYDIDETKANLDVLIEELGSLSKSDLIGSDFESDKENINNLFTSIYNFLKYDAQSLFYNFYFLYNLNNDLNVNDNNDFYVSIKFNLENLEKNILSIFYNIIEVVDEISKICLKIETAHDF